MKKISLIAISIFAVLLFQECKKDSYSASAYSTYSLLAIINDSTWTTDTVTASLVFNASAKTKTFSLTGIANNKEVKFSIQQSTSVNSTGIPLATYTVGGTTYNAQMSFLLNQKDPVSGIYSFQPQGVVATGAGSVYITAIDSVKKQITGTFSMTTSQNNYDSGGNLISVTFNQVQAGGFNNLPYTFVSN